MLIPAYRAMATVGEAVESVLRCGLAAADLEILVEPDDGQDYGFLVGLSDAVRLGPVGPVASGAGAARNRALGRARGRWITCLDADDRWMAGFLPPLLAAAKRSKAAFPRMRFSRDGREVFAFGAPGGLMTAAAMARTGASTRPLVHRDVMPRFVEDLAQDVAHALVVLGRVGGACPVADATYEMRLQAGSITAAADFSARVHRSYQDYIARFAADHFGLGAGANAAAMGVMAAKIALNTAYQTEGAGLSYYEFIAARLGSD